MATKLEASRPKEHKFFLKTKSNGAVPVHTRSEVRRKRGRDNVVAEIQKHRLEVATRLWGGLRALTGFILFAYFLISWLRTGRRPGQSPSLLTNSAGSATFFKNRKLSNTQPLKGLGGSIRAIAFIFSLSTVNKCGAFCYICVYNWTSKCSYSTYISVCTRFTFMAAFDIPSHLRIRPCRDGSFVNLFCLRDARQVGILGA